jgi:anti-anti-sigma regulatory factor
MTLLDFNIKFMESGKKNGKQLPNGLKRAEAKGIITMLFSITPAILLPFELIGYQNSFKTMTKILRTFI